MNQQRFPNHYKMLVQTFVQSCNYYAPIFEDWILQTFLNNYLFFYNFQLSFLMKIGLALKVHYFD